MRSRSAEQLVEFGLAEHGAQRGLRDLRGRADVIDDATTAAFGSTTRK